MNINGELIMSMNVGKIIILLGEVDDYLVDATIPKSVPEDIRDNLLLKYNELTGSNIMTNYERKQQTDIL